MRHSCQAGLTPPPLEAPPPRSPPPNRMPPGGVAPGELGLICIPTLPAVSPHPPSTRILLTPPTPGITLYVMVKAALRRPDEFARGGLRSHERERLLALLHRRTTPDQLSESIRHLSRGASESAAALASGLSRLEWRYVMYLGDSGHPAYAEFARSVRIARGEAQAAMQARVYEREDLEGQKFSLRMMGCEEALSADQPQVGPSSQTVNVIFRDFGEVVDG